ncbi:MAG: NADH-quinone oxidoreductase subunit I, partial [bacterium]|nr:NADH-quinone oxidoreductase subunit I [bacterium]
MGILKEFWKGFKVTGSIGLRGLFGKDIVTTRYPSEMRSKPTRVHGRPVLNRYPDGRDKCIGCDL